MESVVYSSDEQISLHEDQFKNCKTLGKSQGVKVKAVLKKVKLLRDENYW
jgi:hypothetical protein